MELTDKAIKDLIKILEREIGPESVSMLNNKEINDLGIFFLSIFSESLKIKNHKKSI